MPRAPPSFRERYLNFAVDPATLRETGFIALNPNHTGNWPTCVIEGTDRSTCKCPFAANLDPAAIGTGPQSAFRRPVEHEQPATPAISSRLCPA